MRSARNHHHRGQHKQHHQKSSSSIMFLSVCSRAESSGVGRFLASEFFLQPHSSLLDHALRRSALEMPTVGGQLRNRCSTAPSVDALQALSNPCASHIRCAALTLSGASMHNVRWLIPLIRFSRSLVKLNARRHAARSSLSPLVARQCTVSGVQQSTLTSAAESSN